MSDKTIDVLVVGFGFAGAAAAIAAHDAGARVLLIEKRSDAGGISVCSAGGVRVSDKPDQALAYLEATNAGTTPRAVLSTLADGMATVPAWIEQLSQAVGAKTARRPAPGNYPFPGHEAFSFVNVDAVEAFDAAKTYPAVRGSPAGARLFEMMRRNVERRGIETRFGVTAKRLLSANGHIGGVTTDSGEIVATSVVLATGGFEGAADIQRQYWAMKPVLSAAIRTNTGDGLRMAQGAGAALWHMWHYHGSYGFKHPDPAYPFGIRLKRLPDWTPGNDIRDDVTMSWIIVDRVGRRFLNEYEPYMQDTGHRGLEPFDFVSGHAPGLPALLIVDAAGRALYPMSAPTWHDDDVAKTFAGLDQRTLDETILRRFDSIEELARGFGRDPAILKSEIDGWNELVRSGAPDRFGRPLGGRMMIKEPPFSAAEIWPIVSNTQGGPAHDERQRVLDAFGDPIPGLWEAGEIGSVFGHIYMSGGNLAECFVGGRIAGEEAARAAKGA